MQDLGCERPFPDGAERSPSDCRIQIALNGQSKSSNRFMRVIEASSRPSRAADEPFQPFASCSSSGSQRFISGAMSGRKALAGLKPMMC